MDQGYINIQQTLSYFGQNWDKPYYISSGNALNSFPEPAFRTDFFIVAIAITGSATIEINHQKKQILPCTLFTGSPTTIIHFRDSSADFTIKILFFDKNFLLKNINDTNILDKLEFFDKRKQNFTLLTQQEINFIIQIFNHLQEKINTEGIYKDKIIRTIVFYLLLEIAQIYQKKETLIPKKHTRNDDLYFKFTQLIQKNIRKHKEVNFYANELFVSSKHLLVIITKATGKTPLQVIQEALLDEAYLLLANPQNNISSVSYLLNFSSVAAFSRFFKKMTAKTPNQYKLELDT